GAWLWGRSGRGLPDGPGATVGIFARCGLGLGRSPGRPEGSQSSIGVYGKSFSEFGRGGGRCLCPAPVSELGAHSTGAGGMGAATGDAGAGGFGEGRGGAWLTGRMHSPLPPGERG